MIITGMGSKQCGLWGTLIWEGLDKRLLLVVVIQCYLFVSYFPLSPLPPLQLFPSEKRNFQQENGFGILSSDLPFQRVFKPCRSPLSYYVATVYDCMCTCGSVISSPNGAYCKPVIRSINMHAVSELVGLKKRSKENQKKRKEKIREEKQSDDRRTRPNLVVNDRIDARRDAWMYLMHTSLLANLPATCGHVKLESSRQTWH